MDYIDIENFLTIVEKGSLCKAAEALHISQPALSNRLRSLEKQIGTKLIIRKQGSRSIELTAKGHEFIPIAEKWREIWKEAQYIAVSPHHLSLSIASLDSTTTAILSNLFKEILSSDPLIHLTIKTYQSYEIFSLIEKHEFDIGFIIQDVRGKDVVTIPLFKERMLFVCSNEAVQYQGTITPKELEKSNEIFITWSTEFILWNERWFGSEMITYVDIDKITLLEDFLSDGIRWSIVPESIAYHLQKNGKIKILDISPAPNDRITYLLHHSNPSMGKQKSISLFLQYLKTYIMQLPYIHPIPEDASEAFVQKELS